MNEVGGVALSALLAEFDQETLAVLTAPAGLDAVVRSITLSDVGPGGGAADGSLHVASITQESSTELVHLVAACAYSGAAGLILRRSVCTAEVLERARRESSLAVLLASDSITLPNLFTRLTSAFAGLNQAGEVSTLEVPLGDLFALANAIASLVGGATAIEDSQRHVLAYSTLRGQPVDEMRQDGILGRQVPSFPGNDETYRQMWRATSAIRVVSGYPGHLARICVAVRVGTEQLGSIWVIEGEQPFDEESFAALNQAATVAAVHLLRYRHGSGLMQLGRATLLLAQLSGEAHPSTLRQLDMDPRDEFAVIAYKVPDKPTEIVVERVMAIVQFTGHDPHMSIACAPLDADTVCALISDHGPITPSRLKAITQAAVDRVHTVTGISLVAALSTVTHSAVGIPVAAKRVRQALRIISATDGAYGPILDCDSIAAPLFLLSVGELTTDAPSTYSDLILSIEAFDAEHGTSYSRTLKAFFAFAGDVSAAAVHLNVHRNTLRYRLGRIGEIFDTDLNDPDTRLAVWLALRLRELGDRSL